MKILEKRVIRKIGSNLRNKCKKLVYLLNGKIIFIYLYLYLPVFSKDSPIQQLPDNDPPNPSVHSPFHRYSSTGRL